MKFPPPMGPLSFSLMSLYEHHLALEDSSEDRMQLLCSCPQREPSYLSELQAVSITSIHLLNANLSSARKK